MYSTYNYMKRGAVFAASIGIFQSICWMSMTLSGLIAYNCHFSFSDHTADLGSMFSLTFFHVYFRNPNTCTQTDFPLINFNSLAGLNLFAPEDLYAWLWTYFFLHFLWLISSILLIVLVKKKNISSMNASLYTWVGITIVISILDLTLGILFALDYDVLLNRAYSININITDFHFVAVSMAQLAAAVMMTMAFRGYLLWVINVAISIYLFTETFKIHDYNKNTSREGRNAGVTNNAFENGWSHEAHRGKPIDAYANSMQNTRSTFAPNQQYGNQQQMGQNERALRAAPTIPPVVLHHDDRRRADAVRQNRFTQQYPPVTQSPPIPDNVILRRDAASANVARELKDRASYIPPPRVANEFPDPDYSPSMARAQQPYETRPQLRSALRNSRYQY